MYNHIDKKTYFYLLNTPIGNMEDISYRFIKILYNMDILLTESKHRALKIMKYIGINYKHKRICCINNIDNHLLLKNIKKYIFQKMIVVLISDAGIPVIHDPGNYIINNIRHKSFKIGNITGTNSLTSAISGSGLMCQNFTFVGFLPRIKKERRAIIKNIFDNKLSIIIYETCFRINQTLNDIFFFYKHTRFVIARELTKIYESFHYGILGKFIYPWLFYKGELIIIVEYPIYKK